MGFGLVGHELVHVWQYELGATIAGFIGQYILYGHSGSPYEKMARKIEQDILNDLYKCYGYKLIYQ